MKLFFFLVFLFSLLFKNVYSREDLSEEETIRVKNATKLTTNFSKAERSEALTGGAGTVEKVGKNAFSHHFTNLSFEDRQNFLIGNGLFRKLWVAAPSSTVASDGLGPLYNARACQSCHIKDGKGHLPKGEKPLSLVIKVGRYKNIDLLPDKIYGKQFQFFGIPGLESEITGKLVKQKYKGKLLENVNLEEVDFAISSLNYGKFENKNSLSLRVSPHVYGVGLLEAIEESDILRKQDITDNDNDGISGIARLLKLKDGTSKVGRFGIRASTPDL